MADVPEFARQYFKEGNMDMSKFIPNLPIRWREELCLKGAKIAYDDFTKFVKRGDQYTPLVCWRGEVKSTDTVMDFAPLLNVGVAEILNMMSYGNDFVNMSYLGWCQELEFVDDWYTMLDRAGQMIDITVDENNVFMGLSETLRSSLVDYRFPTVRRIYATLQALKWINPKSYCVALIEGMRVACSVISIFMCDITAFDDTRTLGPSATKAAYEAVVKQRLTRHGAVKYTPPGASRERRISDGRGLGLSMLAVFIIDLLCKFGEFRGVANMVPLRNPKSRRHAMTMFEDCLGDDYIGRLLRNGHCRIMDSPEKSVMTGNEANLLAVDCHESSTSDSSIVGRGLVEAHILWKHAVGVGADKDVDVVGVLPPMDVTYGTRVDFVHACLDFAFSDRGMRLSKNIIKKHETELVDAVMKNIDADTILAKYKQDLQAAANTAIKKAQKELDDKTAEVQSLTQAVEEHKHSVTEKQHIIDELRAEVSSLRSKVRSIYSDEVEEASEETDGVVASDVSNEEMLALVNQFRLIVVGGMDTMQSRLEQAGFTNFYCISSERASNSTLVSGDFFCLCTKFLSHKLAYNVETHYSEQLDHFFYFNGTNVDAFLRTCYEFITDWFNSEGGSPNEA